MALQRAGSHTTNSIGSTSCAMTTSLAFLFSTRVVMCLRPYLSMKGFDFWVCSWLSFCNLSVLACLVSGRYFMRRRKTDEAWAESKVRLNWLIGGGTFRRVKRILRRRCSWIYLGQRTNLYRFPFGWMSPPILKFLVLGAYKGFSGSFATGLFFTICDQ